ncbi:NAD(P)-binding domain protein [Niveomyces insectorum RCEF 264]|uniref:NAD(P)-binding domain protein n=1 Tax=Niveomyces insectorum RCEF 264 TaxID=1081102 RepID=A0A167RAH0_9HYPO|nr:NAD(P)-binding domain protein [Niveomyces insectorum RCEF 264]
MSSQAAPSAVPFIVKGKTAIVTGGGSGINLAFAKLLASRDCNVVIADIALRPEAEEFLSNHKGENGGARVAFVETDVTSWKAINRMFEFTLAEFGDFDIVCPGAGVYEPHWSSFWHPPGSPESKDKVDGDRYALLDLNLTHPIRSTQLAIAHWLHPRPPANPNFAKPSPASLQNPKRVVHISSVAAQLPVFRTPMYGATKYAISGFVRCLTPLDGVGIGVTAVAPGIVKTPLWTEHPEKLVNLDEKQDAWVTPEEVAEAMVQCIEKEAGGTILEVGTDSVRPVSAFNDPGPDTNPARGLIASNSQKGDDMVWGWLQDPNLWS